MLTPDQTDLQSKLQQAHVEGFMDINPLAVSQDEAEDLFKLGLPDQTYMDAVAVKKDEFGEHITARFIGVTENDALAQLRRWQDANGYDQLMTQPNPQFGFGMMWLDYFRQPMSQVSIPALVRHFSDWKDSLGVLPAVKVPQGQQKQVGIKAAVPGHMKYARLNSEEAGKVIADLKAGNPLPEGYQIGHRSFEDAVYISDTKGNEKLDHYLTLQDLSEDEWDILLTGDSREELSEDAQKIWDARGREGEQSSEVEQELLDKGYLKDDPDLTFQERMIPVRDQGTIYVQREVGMTQGFEEKPVMEASFSPLELAFDDCPEERQQIFSDFEQKRQERALFSVTDEMRAQIRSYQEAGKAPRLGKDEYKTLTRDQAQAYIDTYRDTPEDTYERIVFSASVKGKTPEAFPHYNSLNLVGSAKADYLQRSVLRDLAKEGHICAEKDIPEFVSKVGFITRAQAKALIEPHQGEAPGQGLLEQTNGFIAAGKLVVREELKTVGDCVKLFYTHKNMDSLAKAALQDLADAGIIKLDEPDKLYYTPELLDQKLLAKHGVNEIGPRLKARLDEMIADARIGSMDRDQASHMTISETIHQIEVNSPLELYVGRHASEQQIGLLQKMQENKQIDLSNVSLDRLSIQGASQLIESVFKKQQNRTTPAPIVDGPATEKQRSALKALVASKSLEKLDSEKWKTLTRSQASALISSVSDDQRKASYAKAYGEQGQARQQVDPQGPATYEQRNLLRALVNKGEVPHFELNQWRSLTAAQAQEALSHVPAERLKDIKDSLAPKQEKTPMADNGMER